MAHVDRLADFGTIDLASLDSLGITLAGSDTIDLGLNRRGFPFEGCFLVIACTATLVYPASEPAFSFTLALSADTTPTGLATGDALWRHGNVDLLGVLGVGLPAEAMKIGRVLFAVAVPNPAIPSATSQRYLGVVVSNVTANLVTSGSVRAYLTTTPPSNSIVYPDAI